MIRYTCGQPLTATQFADVLNRSCIHRPTADLPRLQRMLDEADILWTAWNGERLVGGEWRREAEVAEGVV